MDATIDIEKLRKYCEVNIQDCETRLRHYLSYQDMIAAMAERVGLHRMSSRRLRHGQMHGRQRHEHVYVYVYRRSERPCVL
jgi:hypothetical protein